LYYDFDCRLRVIGAVTLRGKCLASSYKMKDFKKLIVWQKGLTLYTDLHVYCKHLPPEEKFSLVSQIRRAAFSIPANIAEGSSKATKAHYKLYLENSLGSSFELETAL
jgi:hypothetical protein